MSKEKDIANLNKLIADLTVFYQKMRHYHWNVKGPQFFQLHQQFELIYTEIGDAIDSLAERVVSLKGVPFHTLSQMLENTTLVEDAELPGPDEMVARVESDIAALTKSIQTAIESAELSNDRTSVNLLDGINDSLEAHLWMFKAYGLA